MSGIEVVGLVLAALPLVISALEHYESSLDPTIAFFKWNSELKQARRRLFYAHTSYVLSIKALLAPITTDAELDEMMDDAGSHLWTDGNLAKDLQLALGLSYKPYLMTVKEVEEVLKSLTAKLDIQGSEKVTQEGLQAVVTANPPTGKSPTSFPTFEFRRRIKFTMKRQKVKMQLERLQDFTKQLDDFSTKSEKLEESYKTSRRSRIVPSLETVRQNAAKLYNDLARTWCNAHRSHCVGILLEQRLAKKKGRSRQLRCSSPEKSESNRFSVSLQASPNKCLYAEVRLLEIGCVPSQSSTVKVVISEPGPSLTPPQPRHDPSQLPIVTNICTVVQPSHGGIGFYLDENGVLRGAYPVPQQQFAYLDTSISLHDVLAGQSRLGRQEVYLLCITLASSLLQLSHTPWLHHSWNKTDILFLHSKDGSSTAVDLRCPYLTREHSNSSITVRTSHNDGTKLLALSIMLVEIASGQTIESLRRPEDLGPNHMPNDFTDISAIQRWLMEQRDKGDLTLAFSSAISHCIKCFLDPTASLRNPEFSRTIEEHVLAPLEDEMNCCFPGRG